MKRTVAIAVLFASAGCGIAIGIDRFRPCEGMECADASTTIEAGSDAMPDTTTGTDASSDAAAACDPKKPFGSVIALTSLNTSVSEVGGTISSDGKRFYFAREANGMYEVWMANMANGSPSPPAVLVQSISKPDAQTNDFAATESPDGLRLYFYAYRPEATQSFGGSFYAGRAAIGDPWGQPTLLQDGFTAGAGIAYPIPNWIYQPYSFYLYRVAVDNAGNIGTSKESIDDGGSGINVPVDKAVEQAIVTPDELHLYFSSFRSQAYHLHIFASSRASVNAPWGMPVILPDTINTPDNVGPTDDKPWFITPDDCTLYFSSARTGQLDMYKVSRPL